MVTIALDQFFFWLLTGLLGLSVVVLGWFLNSVLHELRGVHNSISELNTNVAIVIEKQTWQEKENDRFDERIRILESQ